MDGADTGNMTRLGIRLNRGARRSYALRANLEAFFALIMVGLAAWAVSQADAGPATTRTVYATGQDRPDPGLDPHEAGDMVDRRIVPDLRWIAERFPIYVTDGYSGPLPDGTHVGCNRCHTPGSDHYNGLAVDIVPVGGSTCNAKWAPITRLAHWAEPVQNHPVPPFRWVGYDGDAGHGCGNHLHLSWNHAPAPEYQLAEWVEVLATGHLDGRPRPARQAGPRADLKPPSRRCQEGLTRRRHPGPDRRRFPSPRTKPRAAIAMGGDAPHPSPSSCSSRSLRASPAAGRPTTRPRWPAWKAPGPTSDARSTRRARSVRGDVPISGCLDEEPGGR